MVTGEFLVAEGLLCPWHLNIWRWRHAGEQYTGASLNIARTLGPVIAYQCHTSDAAWCANAAWMIIYCSLYTKSISTHQ